MKKRRRSLPNVLGLAALALLMAGCARGCTSPRSPIHLNPNMDYQPRYDAQESSDFFYDGRAMREPVAGTVARGDFRDKDPSYYTGMDAAGAFVPASPVQPTDEVLARGLARYTIYCQPCHEKRGTGRGILFQYGGTPTTSYHEQRVIDLADGEMFDVITNGKGLMQGYRYPISVDDRWAIVAHVRRLQQERSAGGR